MKLQLAILVAMVSSGCVGYGPSPDEWGKLEESVESEIDSCPDISGKYLDQTWAISDMGFSKPSIKMNNLATALYSVLNRDFSIATTTVEISQPSEKLILVKPSSGNEFQISSDEGHFECKEGAIALNSLVQLNAPGTFYPLSYVLFGSEDQSLVMRAGAFVVDGSFIVPYVGNVTDWAARWVRVDEKNQPLSPIAVTPEEMAHVARLVAISPGETERMARLVMVPPEEIERMARLVILTQKEMERIARLIAPQMGFVFYASRSTIEYSDVAKANECYRDIVTLTYPSIYAIWNRNSVSQDCPSHEYSKEYKTWNYTDIVSLKSEPDSRVIKIDFKSGPSADTAPAKESAESLVISIGESSDFKKVEKFIEDRRCNRPPGQTSFQRLLAGDCDLGGTAN